MKNLIFKLQSTTIGDIERDIKNAEIDDLMPILLLILFAVIIGGIIGFAILAKSKSNRDNRIYGDDSTGTVNIKEATVVSKRTELSKNQYISDVNYVTFQFLDGERKEFAIKDGSKFGMLVPNDKGILKYRNNQFVDFERKF